MRQDTENRAKKYIKKHENYKKWLAYALCLSLLTGTVTLYVLNKPATAMTEEGAGQVGLVLETADDEFEQGLIEQMESEENETSESSISDGEGENVDLSGKSEPDQAESGDEKTQESANENKAPEETDPFQPPAGSLLGGQPFVELVAPPIGAQPVLIQIILHVSPSSGNSGSVNGSGGMPSSLPEPTQYAASLRRLGLWRSGWRTTTRVRTVQPSDSRSRLKLRIKSRVNSSRLKYPR